MKAKILDLQGATNLTSYTLWWEVRLFDGKELELTQIKREYTISRENYFGDLIVLLG